MSSGHTVQKRAPGSAWLSTRPLTRGLSSPVQDPQGLSGTGVVTGGPLSPKASPVRPGGGPQTKGHQGAVDPKPRPMEPSVYASPATPLEMAMWPALWAVAPGPPSGPMWPSMAQQPQPHKSHFREATGNALSDFCFVILKGPFPLFFWNPLSPQPGDTSPAVPGTVGEQSKAASSSPMSTLGPHHQGTTPSCFWRASAR